MVIQIQEVREVQEAQMACWVVHVRELFGRAEKVQDRQRRRCGLALVVQRDRGWPMPGRWRSGCEDAWRRSDWPKGEGLMKVGLLVLILKGIAGMIERNLWKDAKKIYLLPPIHVP